MRRTILGYTAIGVAMMTAGDGAVGQQSDDRSVAGQAEHAPAAQAPAEKTPEQTSRDTAKKSSTAPAVLKRPLERLAQEHILVLPVQYLTFSDSLGWAGKVASTSEYLETLDDELTFALGERGLKKRWMLSNAVVRSVKRNPQLTVDPHGIGGEQVRMGVRPKDGQLQDPLASQLRSLIALSDARHVLFPVELRFTNAKQGGGGQAVLHVVVIDARRGQIQWAGDILGEPAAKFTPALAADLAARLADLIAPPAR